MKRISLIAALLASACGSATTPAAPTTSPPPIVSEFQGTVSATNGGQALGGVSVSLAAQVVTTDASGAFDVRVPGNVGVLSLTASGPAILQRVVMLRGPGHSGIAVDAFQLAGFDLAFYRAFVRNGFEQPNQLQPLRRQQQAPRIYLKTVDEAGLAIPDTDAPTSTALRASRVVVD